jgi:hypothetical protein
MLFKHVAFFFFAYLTRPLVLRGVHGDIVFLLKPLETDLKDWDVEQRSRGENRRDASMLQGSPRKLVRAD